jgi:hypothetical protein
VSDDGLGFGGLEEHLLSGLVYRLDRDFLLNLACFGFEVVEMIRTVIYS